MIGEEITQIPPLELRTAYTVKGLGIGGGALVGYLIGERFRAGALGALALGVVGWFAGNTYAASAERKYSHDR